MVRARVRVRVRARASLLAPGLAGARRASDHRHLVGARLRAGAGARAWGRARGRTTTGARARARRAGDHRHPAMVRVRVRVRVGRAGHLVELETLALSLILKLTLRPTLALATSSNLETSLLGR